LPLDAGAAEREPAFDPPTAGKIHFASATLPINRRLFVALILLVLLLALLFFGLGFALHVLWIVAVILFVAWIIGWAFARGQSSGSRRQWYGRW
jgi:hypothetical protein